MKTYCHLLAAIAAAFVGSVSATPCTVDQTRSAYLNMISLLTGSTVSDCATNSGYNMLYSSAAPTDSQMISLCGVQVCHDLVVRVLATNPPDCDLTIPTSNAVMNVYQLAINFESNCDALTNPTSAPTDAPTSAPTEAPTDEPTEAPTSAPTNAPAETPTTAPTDAPTAAPTDVPTSTPTEVPTEAPTEAPTSTPEATTDAPTEDPTEGPTEAPTQFPTTAPTEVPTMAPPSETGLGKIIIPLQLLYFFVLKYVLLVPVVLK